MAVGDNKMKIFIEV